MLKQRCGWVGLIGLALALPAAAVVQSGTAYSQNSARLRVPAAVAHLEQCFSYHSQNPTCTLVYRATGFRANDLAPGVPSDISELPDAEQLTLRVDHHLIV